LIIRQFESDRSHMFFLSKTVNVQSTRIIILLNSENITARAKKMKTKNFWHLPGNLLR